MQLFNGEGATHKEYDLILMVTTVQIILPVKFPRSVLEHIRAVTLVKPGKGQTTFVLTLVVKPCVLRLEVKKIYLHGHFARSRTDLY